MEVKVTVIMPMLNAARYIRECLDSVVGQTLREIEIICVDAGSTDGTREIIQEYAGKDERIRLIDSPYKSYGYQMNLGLDAARGEFFGIVESDDYIVPEMYETLYGLAKKHGLDAVKSDFSAFLGAGSERTFVQRRLTEEQKYYGAVMDPSVDMDLFRANNINPCGIYSMDMIREHHIRLNETPGASFQDNGLWFQIFMYSRRMMFCDRQMYMVRRDNAGSSVRSTGKVFCMCDEYDYIRDVIRRAGLLEKYGPVCAVYRYAAYQFTLNRIADEYKLSFLYKFSFDFGKLKSFGELDEHLFSAYQWSVIQQVISDPYKFYCTKYIKSKPGASEAAQLQLMRRRLDAANEEIRNIHASATYRIGRVITWLPRKVRGGVRCFQEHGTAYTLRRVLVHLHLAEDEYKAVPAPVKPAATVQKPAAPAVKKPAPVRRDYNYYASLPPEKYPEELKLWFKRVMGEDLDLENPKTFNQKIQWLKLYDSTPIKTRLTDKYLVRDWIKEKIGEEYLIPLLGVWDSFDEIDFDALPDQFVLKANHGCGWNIIVKDKTQLNFENARNRANFWMMTNFAFRDGFELQYLNIRPRIIAERYIHELDGDLYDYKFYCFAGKPEFIQCIGDRDIAKHTAFQGIYNLNWEKMDWIFEDFPRFPYEVPKPACLEVMIDIAKKLSEGFEHVRVDLYEVDGHVYFGEMTFTTGSGVVRHRGSWTQEKDMEIGNMIQLPPKSPFPVRCDEELR